MGRPLCAFVNVFIPHISLTMINVEELVARFGLPLMDMPYVHTIEYKKQNQMFAFLAADSKRGCLLSNWSFLLSIFVR